jgi:hypothetical protein
MPIRRCSFSEKKIMDLLEERQQWLEKRFLSATAKTKAEDKTLALLQKKLKEFKTINN